MDTILLYLRSVISLMLLMGLFKSSAGLAQAPSDDSLLLVDVLAWFEEHQPQRVFRQAELLQLLLTDFPTPFVVERITRNRARVFVASNKQACMPWLLKTPEREKLFLFSLPYAVESALVLVVKKDSAWAQHLTNLQNSGVAISLNRLLLQHSPPILGVESQRSYGVAVDSLLKQSNAFPIYTRTSSSDEPAAMLPMLEKGFIDIMLEYPSVLAQYSAEVVYFNFVETEPVQFVHFACSNTAEMKQLMPLINRHIKELSGSTQYIDLVLRELPENQREQALALWLAILKNN